MSGLALAVAIVAPIISGSSGTGPTMPPVELPVVEMHPIPPARTPAPGPERIVEVPGGYEMTMELAASTVVPKPPPPPPPPKPSPVFQMASPVPAAPAPVDHSAAITRAKGAANGELPADALCGLSWDPDALLRCDAAASLERAANNGMPRVALTSTYRSLADQHAVKASRGSWAARPGTSVHGFGLAIDAPEPMRSWLHANGPAYGWIWPAWAQDPNRYESWHFEAQL